MAFERILESPLEPLIFAAMANDGGDDGDGFLLEFGGLVDEEKVEELNEVTSSATKQEEGALPLHNSKKPKWWLQLSRRRGTKAQRRTMAAMSDYILTSPRYGEFLDWNKIFSSTYKEIWFEVGFGLGDNLLCNAEMHPDKAMVGADVHMPGAATVLKRMKEAQEQGRYWDEYSLLSQHKEDSTAIDGNDDAHATTKTVDDICYSNVRIYPGNGMKLLHSIPTSSLTAVLMTFPDPWPHERNAEYRLLQVSTAADFYRVLRDDGRFYLATDHEGYFDWCLSVMTQCQHLYAPVMPVPDRSSWLPVVSKYEQKGLDEGRHTQLACWQVIDKELD